MPHPFRILFLSGNAPPAIDGVGDYTDRLLQELRRQRPDWSFYWLSRRPRWFSSPYTRRGGVPLIRPVRTWDSPGSAIAMIRILRPEILHIQEELFSFHETDAASQIARETHAKVVTTLHEFHSDHPRIAVTMELVRTSQVVIANDPRTAARCLSATGRPVDQTLWSGATILPPALAVRPPIVRDLVVTFGFISALKSLDTLHEALKAARNSRPNLRWRIIGPFEPATNAEHAALWERFRPDSHWIEFTGAVTDHARLRHLIAEGEAMLLPFADGASTRRGTLQVAWAFGIPVVTTPTDEPTDAIREGENVLFARETGTWTENVLRILSDQACARDLRKGGLKSAESFSWRHLSNEHIKFYENLMRVYK